MTQQEVVNKILENHMNTALLHGQEFYDRIKERPNALFIANIIVDNHIDSLKNGNNCQLIQGFDNYDLDFWKDVKNLLNV